jgi:hypothetical protein
MLKLRSLLTPERFLTKPFFSHVSPISRTAS